MAHRRGLRLGTDVPGGAAYSEGDAARVRWTMALGLTPEHLELAAAVRGWAERHCPVDVPRAASGQPDGGGQQYRDTLGPSLAAQGVLGLHLPEKHGGQGYGLPELAVATEELGRALLPGAFLPTVWASAVLAAVVAPAKPDDAADQIGRASCRGRRALPSVP